MVSIPHSAQMGQMWLVTSHGITGTGKRSTAEPLGLVDKAATVAFSAVPYRCPCLGRDRDPDNQRPKDGNVSKIFPHHPAYLNPKETDHPVVFQSRQSSATRPIPTGAYGEVSAVQEWPGPV